MTTSYRRNLTCLAAAVVAASWVAGCGSGGHKSVPPPSVTGSDVNPKAAVVVTQLVLDTGVLPASDVDPGVVVDGLVKDGGQFTTWYATRTNDMLLSKDSTLTVPREADKISTAMASMGKSRTLASLQPTASGILAQELVDAKLINAQALGGAVDSVGTVNLGSALNSWYSAHQNDMLPGSTSVTYSTEVTRILNVLQSMPS